MQTHWHRGSQKTACRFTDAVHGLKAQQNCQSQQAKSWLIGCHSRLCRQRSTFQVWRCRWIGNIWTGLMRFPFCRLASWFETNGPFIWDNFPPNGIRFWIVGSIWIYLGVFWMVDTRAWNHGQFRVFGLGPLGLQVLSERAAALPMDTTRNAETPPNFAPKTFQKWPEKVPDVASDTLAKK